MPVALFGSVAAMWALAVVTPGPNFFAAARVAAARSRRTGLATVAGIGLGTAMWGLTGCFGVQIMFAMVPWLYGALKLVGAIYLIVVGLRIISGSFRPGLSIPQLAPGPAFRLGLLTSIANPKSALFVGSMFAAVLPPTIPIGIGLLAVAEMVVISVGWYALVVCLLTTSRAAMTYRRLRATIDRLAGAIFIAFGTRLLLDRT